MPTLLNRDGFKFFFYANEHLPKHIHVLYADRWAKIELDTFHDAYSSLKANESARCLAIVREHNALFKERWNEWFPGR